MRRSLPTDTSQGNRPGKVLVLSPLGRGLRTTPRSRPEVPAAGDLRSAPVARSGDRATTWGKRPGKVLVLFAFLLPMLLGTTGLVIDTGLLLAAHRQAQNAADAAALAAALQLFQ